MVLKRISSSVLFVGLLVPLAPACTSGLEADCIDVCEDSKACPDGNKNEDCAASCDLLASDAEEKNCEKETAALVACSRKDVCIMTSACGAESDAYSACLQAFCTGNPHDPGCIVP